MNGILFLIPIYCPKEDITMVEPNLMSEKEILELRNKVIDNIKECYELGVEPKGSIYRLYTLNLILNLPAHHDDKIE